MKKQKHLDIYHSIVTAFGFAALIVSLFSVMQVSRYSSVSAAGSLTADNSTIRVEENNAKIKYGGYIRIEALIDPSFYSYDISFAVDAGCTISVDGSSGAYNASGTLLSIPLGASSYSLGNQFHFKTVDDALIGEPDSTCVATFTMVSTDSSVNGDQVSVTLIAEDDDAVPALVVTPVETGTLVEGPASATENRVAYTVKTSDPPLDNNATARITSDANCQVGFDASGKGGGVTTFTSSAEAWVTSSFERKFYIIPVDDSVAEGSHTCTVSFVVISPDPQYSGITASPLVVNITDNDGEPSSSSNNSAAQEQQQVQTEQQAADPQDEEDVVLEPVALPEGLESITFNNASQNDFNGTQIQKGESFVVKGIATPFAKITIYIFSDPIVATVEADAQGVWEYTVEEEIAAGNHRIEAELLGANSEEPSERILVAQFTVQDPAEQVIEQQNEQPVPAQNEDTSSSNIVVMIIVALVVIAGSVVGYIVYRRKKTNAPTMGQTTGSEGPFNNG